MNIALWIVAGLTALAFLGAGANKIARGKKVEEMGMAWAKHYSDPMIRGIGAVEILGALGLVLPAATGIAVWLTPAAAIGLVLVMIGAVVQHLKDGDGIKGSAPAIVLGLLAAFVAVGRLVIAPF